MIFIPISTNYKDMFSLCPEQVLAILVYNALIHKIAEALVSSR